MLVVESNLMYYEMYIAVYRMRVKYFLFIVLGVFQNDVITRGVDEFAFADYGAEGGSAADAHQTDGLDGSER